MWCSCSLLYGYGCKELLIRASLEGNKEVRLCYDIGHNDPNILLRTPPERMLIVIVGSQPTVDPNPFLLRDLSGAHLNWVPSMLVWGPLLFTTDV